MANPDKPKGFRFAYTTHGGPPAMNMYRPVGDVAIYNGDIVYQVNGRINSMTTASEASPVGVAAAYSASTDETSKIPVYDDLRNTIFIAQADGADIAGTSVIGNNTLYDVNYGTPTTASELSLMEIDSDASANDSLYIIDKVDRPDNDWGANVDCYVQIRLDGRSFISAPVAT